MNQVAVVKPKSVMIDMATRYGMEPQAFEATVRATCLPPDRKTGREATREEFAAFLLVAKEYRLNPVTREIFAFMAKHGGIVPVVSVDGWISMVNSHSQCDGFSFEMTHDDHGAIVGCTCRMYRKDRKHPVEVTEYFSECRRDTDPWRSMPHRMIRHKALIQAARLAFGFSGIFDEDEGQTIAEATDVTPLRVPSPSEVEGKVIDIAPVKPDPISSGPAPKKSSGPDIDKDYDGFITWALDQIKSIDDPGALETFLVNEIQTREGVMFPPDFQDIVDCYSRRQTMLNSEE